MNDWVPFHRSLTRGAKRGLSRATRFVYLEIALEARGFGGSIPLPSGFKCDADALHDMLGGDRRELVAAIEQLTRSHDGDEPMLRIEGSSPRRVVVVAFDTYQFKSDRSTPRVQKHRERKRAAASTSAVSTETDETVSVKRVERHHSTEQYRTEQNRTEDPPLPPQGVCTNPTRVNGVRDDVIDWAIPRWSEAIRRVTGARAMPIVAGKERGMLIAAIRNHCPPGQDVGEWADRAGAAYATGNRGRTLDGFYFEKWLRSGGYVPEAPRPTKSPEPLGEPENDDGPRFGPDQIEALCKANTLLEGAIPDRLG